VDGSQEDCFVVSATVRPLEAVSVSHVAALIEEAVVHFEEFGALELFMSFFPALNNIEAEEAHGSDAAPTQLSEQHVAIAAALVDREDLLVGFLGLSFVHIEIEFAEPVGAARLDDSAHNLVTLSHSDLGSFAAAPLEGIAKSEVFHANVLCAVDLDFTLHCPRSSWDAHPTNETAVLFDVAFHIVSFLDIVRGVLSKDGTGRSANTISPMHFLLDADQSVPFW
jgi:hypothetical protein